MERVLNSGRNSEIKQQIKLLFKERDCFTMVRPVTNETQLQDLSNLDNKELRTEFLEQVILLRKKILNNCRSKKFKGSKLNGEQFLKVIENYISIINSGSIPSVDDIWNSLCKLESAKAIEVAAKEYEKIFKEKIKENNYKPFDLKSLVDNHNEAKRKSLFVFKRNSITNEESFISELKSKLKEKFSIYNKNNEEEVQNEIYKILKRNFEIMELKLKSKEIKTISQVEEYLNLVESEVYNSFPETKLRNEMVLDFKLRIMLFASSFIIANLENQIEKIVAEKTKNEENSKNEIFNNKLKNEEESKKKEILLSELKTENLNLKSELNKLKENSSIELNEKNKLVKNLSEMLLKIKEENKKESEKVQNTLKLLEEEKYRLEKFNKSIQADSEKDKALLEQKLEHLNKILEEIHKREKFSGEDLKPQLKEQSIHFKETTSKYENTINNLKQEIENIKEKNVDLESELKHRENLMELEKIKYEETSMKYETERIIFLEKMNKIKTKLEEENLKLTKEYEEKENLLKEKIIQLKLREDEISQKLEKSQDEFKKTKSRMERENLTLKQNKEFLEMKSSELNTRIEEYKINQEKIISMIDTKINEANSYSQSDLNKRIQEMKTLFEQEKKQIEFKYEKEKETLIRDVKIVEEKLIAKTKTEEEMSKTIEELKSTLEKTNQKLETLQNEKFENERILNESITEYSNKIKILNEEFEKILEEKEKFYRTELANLNKNSEDALNQVKSLYQLEKIRFEEKIRDEKMKFEMKIKNINEENENRIRETEKEYQTEIEELKDEIIQIEQDSQSYIYNAEYEMNLARQTIMNLETQVREERANAENLEKGKNQETTTKMESIKNEKEELQNKLDGIRYKYENEINSLKLKIETLEKNLLHTEQYLIAERKKFEDNLKDITNKHDLYKSKQQEFIDDLSIKKLELIRETALLKQQIDFLNNKIEEHVKTNEEYKKEYSSTIHSLKMESEKEINRRIEIISKEKEDLNEKLNKKRKELRDLEQAFLKQTCFIEKDKNLLNDKIRNLENEKKEIAENSRKDLEKFSKEAQVMKMNYLKEIENLQNQNDDVKRRIKDIQISYIENETNFEKEKSLIENKFKLVEKQKEDYKKELIETQMKVEKIIEAFQKKSNYEKEQLDFVFKEKLNEVEQKYQQYIKELQDNHNTIYSDMVIQNRELEQELKNLSSQAELRNKIITDPQSINKKINELIEIQDKLKKELDETKIEKEKKLSEIQFIADREKEMLKLKIADVEQLLNNVEQKKSLISLEYEKEKARWGLEKDHLSYSMMELQETLDRLQKKGENLLRENEKIKADKEKEKESLNKKINSLINSNNLYKEFSTSSLTPTKDLSKSKVYAGRQRNEINSSMAERINQYNTYDKAEKVDRYDNSEKYYINVKEYENRNNLTKNFK